METTATPTASRLAEEDLRDIAAQPGRGKKYGWHDVLLWAVFGTAFLAMLATLMIGSARMQTERDELNRQIEEGIAQMDAEQMEFYSRCLDSAAVFYGPTRAQCLGAALRLDTGGERK